MKQKDPFALCFRRAQSEWLVPVSSGAVHAANHSVPWICSEQRRRSGQCGPQCTTVPQNHGRREVMSSSSSQILFCQDTFPLRMTEALFWWIQTTQITSNVETRLFLCPKLTPGATWISYCSRWRFSCPKTHVPLLDILHICHKWFFFSFCWPGALAVSFKITADKFWCNRRSKEFREIGLGIDNYWCFIYSLIQDGWMNGRNSSHVLKRGEKRTPLNRPQRIIIFKDCPVFRWLYEKIRFFCCILTGPRPCIFGGDCDQKDLKCVIHFLDTRHHKI